MLFMRRWWGDPNWLLRGLWLGFEEIEREVEKLEYIYWLKAWGLLVSNWGVGWEERCPPILYFPSLLELFLVPILLELLLVVGIWDSWEIIVSSIQISFYLQVFLILSLCVIELEMNDRLQILIWFVG
jgi:hypothetical protein